MKSASILSKTELTVYNVSFNAHVYSLVYNSQEMFQNVTIKRDGTVFTTTFSIMFLGWGDEG